MYSRAARLKSTNISEAEEEADLSGLAKCFILVSSTTKKEIIFASDTYVNFLRTTCPYSPQHNIKNMAPEIQLKSTTQ
jgi:hypothetical protein